MKNDQNKLLIDYKLVSFIVPLILAGTMVGVVVMKILPPLIIFIFLILYLFLSIRKVVKKGLELDRKEREKQEKRNEIELINKG